MAALLPFSACFLPFNATAQTTYTWDGGGTFFNDWSRPNNWAPNGAPPTASGLNNFIFTDNSLRPSPNFENTYTINSLTFGAGGGAFGFTGSGFTPGLTINSGGIVNNSGSAQSFASSLPTIALGTSQTWNAGSTSGGSLSIASGVSLGASQILTISGSNNTAISGIISDAGSGSASSILKTGTGTLALTRANTFNGGITISQGTVTSNAAAGAGSGTITLGDAGTGTANTAFLLNPSANLTVANDFIVSSSGSGTATIGTTSGTLVKLNGDLQLNRPTTLTGVANDRTGYTGVISGNVGTLTISGGARTTFDNASTFVGDVVITGTGTRLQVRSDGPGTIAPNAAFVSGTSVTVDTGASFLLGYSISESIGGLNGAGTVSSFATGTGSANPVILTVGTGNRDGDFSGNITQNSNPVAIVKTGTGTQILSGSSNYGGYTQISGGTLSVATLANGGSNSSIGASSTAASNLVFDGGTLQYTGATVTSDRNFSITASKTATVDVLNAATILTLPGATGAATTGGLTKTGDGTLKLTGTQTYTGNTVINDGTLLLGNNNILSNSSNVILNGGKLDTGGFSDTAGTLLLSSSSVIDMNTASSALSFANSSGTGTWSGILSIFNWPFNGSTVRFGSNATGLTPAQLSNIRVYTGPDNSSPSWTPSIDGNGYLVVVPEPGAVLATLFMLAGIGWRERAQFMRVRQAN